MSQSMRNGLRRSISRGLPLFMMGGMVCLITSCTPVGDVTQGRPIADTAWKSQGDFFLQTTVVYEMSEGRTLAVAHLTISEDLFENGFFGEPGTNAPVRPEPVGDVIIGPDGIERPPIAVPPPDLVRPDGVERPPIAVPPPDGAFVTVKGR